MILVVGWGRLGRHITYLIAAKEQPVLIWHVRQKRLVQVRHQQQRMNPSSSTARAQSSLDPSLSLKSYADYALAVEQQWENIDSWSTLLSWAHKEQLIIEAILLCLPDRLLNEAITQLQHTDYRGILIHFSGAFYHPQSYDIHPLASFDYELFPEALYASIFWISSHPLPPAFQQKYLPFIRPTQCLTLPRQHKALYHALCVLAGPGAQVIWQQVATELEKIGLPWLILLPYLQTLLPPSSSLSHPPVTHLPQTSANAITLKVTGPWQRQDQNTINAHLAELPPALQNLYKQLMVLATPAPSSPQTQQESL